MFFFEYPSIQKDTSVKFISTTYDCDIYIYEIFHRII